MRKDSGLGLLEVAITVFLVMIGLLVVVSSYAAISRNHNYNNRMQVAVTLATKEMAKIRQTPFVEVKADSGAYLEYCDYPDYRHQVAVTNLGSVKEVRLRVYFENDKRFTELRTYLSAAR